MSKTEWIGNLKNRVWLAKTGKDGAPGQDVEAHGRLTRDVADWLVRKYFPFLLERLPENWDLAMLLHDIGKIGYLFQLKVDQRLGVIGFRPDIVERENSALHDELSRLTIVDIEDENGNFIEDENGNFADLLGSHHGKTAWTIKSSANWIFESDFEGVKGMFREIREKLARRLCDGRPFPRWKKDDAGGRLLLGLLVVSDWIASGIWSGMDSESVGEKAEELGFAAPVFRGELEFGEIFGFAPNRMQERALAAFSENPGASVIILEMPMGSGKTELALMLAYLMQTGGSASGIYFGLPTRMTSSMIKLRFDAFIKKAVSPDRPFSSVLVHESRLRADRDGEDGAAPFFRGRMSLLAPFVTGTIDQALMAVMNVRHSAVRALGLSGKTVILDEVHSYDAYSGYILDCLVKRLRELGAKVVILSATLTSSRRMKLLGLEERADGEPKAYPLMTMASGDSIRTVELPAPKSERIFLSLVPDEDAVLAEVGRRVRAGQRVLWIENTVKSAQDIFLKGGGVFDFLLHARFRACFRNGLEERCLALFGRERRGDFGRAMIGTQILEQSLDLDADFMVMRLCPMDMVFQRLGRLWRHERPRKCGRREAVILVPENGENGFGSSAHVYDPYILACSLRALENLSGGEIVIPDDIPRLLGEAYHFGGESGDMAELREKSLKKSAAKRERAERAVGDADSTADDRDENPDFPTRIGRFQRPALLVREIAGNRREGYSLVGIDGDTVPLASGNSAAIQDFLAGNTVPVPAGQLQGCLAESGASWKKDGRLDALGKFASLKNMLVACVNGKDGIITNIDGEPQGASYTEGDCLGLMIARRKHG